MKKLTQQQAIHQNCKECIYDEHEPGGWRQQAGACSITSCALYIYRPNANKMAVGAVSDTMSWK